MLMWDRDTSSGFPSPPLKRLVVSAFPEYGFYQFRFFKGGKAQTVLIDDLLPVESTPTYVCSHLNEREVLWLPLLEKAYAKLHRSYGALDCNITKDHGTVPAIIDALTDLTGSIVTSHSVSLERKSDIWALLTKRIQQGDIVGGCLEGSAPRAEDKRHAGILVDAAYRLADTRLIEGTHLVKVYQPWEGSEWRGRWSWSSKQWTPVHLRAIGALRISSRRPSTTTTTVFPVM
jgi:hypothetical protein